MILELKTKNNTKAGIIYKKGSHSKIFAISISYKDNYQNAKLIAHLNNQEIDKLLSILSLIRSDY